MLIGRVTRLIRNSRRLWNVIWAGVFWPECSWHGGLGRTVRLTYEPSTWAWSWDLSWDIDVSTHQKSTYKNYSNRRKKDLFQTWTVFEYLKTVHDTFVSYMGSSTEWSRKGTSLLIHSEGPDAVPCDPACKSEGPGLIQRQQLFINCRLVHSRASTQLTSIRAT